MKSILLIIGLFILLLTGCKEARVEREKFENDAVKSVQEADSIEPGISCGNYIIFLLQTLKASGHHIKVNGWLPYKEADHTVVILQIEDNADKREFKWHIEDGMVFPANDLAAAVMKNQKAKFSSGK
jgi:hypothetical protein